MPASNRREGRTHPCREHTLRQLPSPLPYPPSSAHPTLCLKNNTPYAAENIRSVGRFRKNIPFGFGIHCLSPGNGPALRLRQHAGRHFHQQSHGRNERPHPGATLQRRPRRAGCRFHERPCPPVAPRARSHRPTCPGRTAVHPSRLRPFPGGNHRLLFPISSFQSGPRVGFDARLPCRP